MNISNTNFANKINANYGSCYEYGDGLVIPTSKVNIHGVGG